MNPAPALGPGKENAPARTRRTDMGRVVATEFVSLDGVFEDPGGAEGSRHGPWTLQFDRGPDGDQFKLDELKGAGAQLLGRVTYEVFAAAWPSRQDEVGFAEL